MTKLLKSKIQRKSVRESSLVGVFSNPFEKYAKVNLDHFPRDRGENKKYLKTPPSSTTNFLRHLKISPLSDMFFYHLLRDLDKNEEKLGLESLE